MHRALRARAAWLTIDGALLSGPFGVLLVLFVAPQPAWVDVPTFVAHYHWVQAVPYAFGFVMLVGFALFVGTTAAALPEAQRGLGLTALLFTGVGLASAATNYVAQLAYIPFALRPENAVLEAVAMANPRAFTWGLEMFAYAWIGIGMWLLTGAFPGAGVRRWIRRLLALNALVSVAGAALTVLVDAWVLTPFGLAAFLAWNVLVVALMVAVVVDARDGLDIGAGSAQNQDGTV